MDLRKDVTVDRLRGRWTTNMSDEDLRRFYWERCDRVRAEQFGFNLPGACIDIKIIAEALPFRDGMCLWHGVNERQTVIFRTMEEWELFEARQREIQEWREEQEASEPLESHWVEKCLYLETDQRG